LKRDGGRDRKSRGRSRSEDEAFGGVWSPPRDSGRPVAPFPASGFGPESEAVVKWFNAEKGFGFVEIAAGGGDAFLHASVLERAGAKQAEPGATLRVRTGPGQKGLQVTEVLSIAEGVSPPGGGRLQPRSRDPRPPMSPSGEGQDMHGTVKWYDAAKGFGFVAPADGSKDVFVHVTALERSGLRALSEGQSVRMQVVQGRKGPEAGTISVE
jgi:CspA family cold shock protein